MPVTNKETQLDTGFVCYNCIAGTWHHYIKKGGGRLISAVSADLKALLWAERDEDAKLVQKGLLLYRQGLVAKLRVEDDVAIAAVQDVTVANVRLNLNFLQVSTCTCPAEGMCRHQLATFFLLYSKVGSVSEWVEEWRQPLREKKAAQQWGVQRAKELLKATGTPPKHNYDTWVTGFHESFQSIMNGQKHLKPYLVPELFHVYTRKIKAGAPMEKEWRQLYLLISMIHTFRNLLQFSKERNYSASEISRHYRQLFYTIIDEIEELVEHLSIHALPFAFDEFIGKLRNDSLYLITDNYELEFERTHLYVILWTKLFKKKDWHEEERTKLDTLKNENNSTPLMIAIIHQKMMLREDEAALRMIPLIKEDAALYMLFWLEQLHINKDWKRMGPFVERFATVLRPYLRTLADSYAQMDFTRFALRVATEYCLLNQKVELYEKILVATLPFSYRTYDDFLFKQQAFEKWGDLQAYIGLDIGTISKEKMKFLQKEEPATLLPLYHQSIQEHINMKNRGHYKEAVKQLKKLRTIYKNLKRQDDWQQYLTLLLERTKRLRAFQEECARGKLIHA